MKRWSKRPQGSNWGDFGENDQVGRLNLIGPEQVRKGVAEVKVGKTFCLSLPLDYPGDGVIGNVRKAPQLNPVLRNDTCYYNYLWKEKEPRACDIACDDFATIYLQYSTHWDGLAHRGALFDISDTGQSEPVYYNGYKADEDVVMTKRVEEKAPTVKAAALGIENAALHGIQGRGVLINLYDYFGSSYHEVTYRDLKMIMDKEKISVEPGDILCLWTGLDNQILEMNKRPGKDLKKAFSVLDGFDEELLDWIRTSEVSAIASDNIAIEALGKKQETDKEAISLLPLHDLCLFRLGVHLGELWYLAELAQWLKGHNRSRFLLTAPPLRLTGAIGSPVTPIATV